MSDLVLDRLARLIAARASRRAAIGGSAAVAAAIAAEAAARRDSGGGKRKDKYKDKDDGNGNGNGKDGGRDRGRDNGNRNGKNRDRANRGQRNDGKQSRDGDGENPGAAGPDRTGDGRPAADCRCGRCQAACAPVVCERGCEHRTVQAAIDAARPGGVVDIGPGTYRENLSVRRPVMLRACKPGSVTIANATPGARAIDVLDGAEISLQDIAVERRDGAARGGGIASSGSVSLCGGSTVRKARNDRGGGIYMNLYPGDRARIALSDTASVEGNAADDFGGGILAYGDIEITLDDEAAIRGNTVDSYGGGIAFGNGARLAVGGSAAIEDNAATADGSASGGGIYADGFSGLPMSLAIRGSARLAGNRAAHGGGLYFGGGSGDGRMTVEIGGEATVRENVAAVYGGGLMVARASLLLTGAATVTGNAAKRAGEGAGGGIFVTSEAEGYAPDVSALRIEERAAVTGNTAALGGGIVLFGGAGTIAGAADVSGNEAPGSGGGILLNSFDAHMASLRIAGDARVHDNRAGTGGGIYSEDPGNTLTGAAAIRGNAPDDCAGDLAGSCSG
ncbi:MAG: hypothetical protein ACKOWF_02420 [Chloroflexota bacterium]